MTPTVSVIIPAYNGKGQLEANLPLLLETTRGLAQEVIVVDDASADGTPTFLADRFPEIRLMALAANRGFGGACNAGVEAAKGEIVYLLNSDVQVRQGFLERVLTRFSDPLMFAVGSREIGPHGGATATVAVPFFRFGLFGHRYVETVGIPRDPFSVPFVSAGHAAFSREKFLSLGGFDDLYRPFYWEDIDLCYRAWRRGWRVILEPQSAVYHGKQGTIGRFYTHRAIQSVYWKNRFLFTWKNLRDAAYIAEHLAWLPALLVSLPIVKGPAVLQGFAWAVRQLGEVLRKRRLEPDVPLLCDREILGLFSTLG
jgi:GT2 family glycosyltransferase